MHSSQKSARLFLRVSISALFAGTLFWCIPGNASVVQTNLAVTVRHAPTLTSGTIEGSLQLLNGENVTLDNGDTLTGDLLVPGTPTLVTNGQATFAGTLPGTGSTSPAGYEVKLSAGCSLNYLRTRTTPVDLPTVSPPPAPSGTRNVTISSPNHSFGDPASLRNLTIGSDVGLVAVPPGTYGAFTVNSGSGLVLGVAGGEEPVQYNLQSLNFNSSTTLKVVGPVVLTLANGFTANGVMGTSNNPAWLQVQIAGGNFTLNTGCTVYGLVLVPNGTVNLNTHATLVGTSASSHLVLNTGALVRWGGATVAPPRPPVATDQAVTLAENSSALLTLSGSDPQGAALTYTVLTQPAHGLLSGTPPSLVYRPATLR